MRTRLAPPLAPCFGECPTAAPCLQCRCRDWAEFPRPDLTGDEWRIIRQYLAARSGCACERCGHPFEIAGNRSMTAHHRRHLGMGGHDDHAKNGLANLAALCWVCHLGTGSGGQDAVEAAPGLARAQGWTVTHGLYVPGERPPEIDVPVLLLGRRRAWLDPTSAVYLTAPAA